MEGAAFDIVSRRLARSRHTLVGAGLMTVGAMVGIPISGPPERVASKKRKQAPLVRNAFGCVDVGGKCRGSNENCCSGVCQGSKPRKGKQDRSVCLAHDTGACLLADDSCAENAASTPCQRGGICVRTTGNAPFCGLEGRSSCQVCTRDSDCRALLGGGSACTICDKGNCSETGFRVCVAPA